MTAWLEATNKYPTVKISSFNVRVRDTRYLLNIFTTCLIRLEIARFSWNIQHVNSPCSLGAATHAGQSDLEEPGVFLPVCFHHRQHAVLLAVNSCSLYQSNTSLIDQSFTTVSPQCHHSVTTVSQFNSNNATFLDEILNGDSA